MDEITLRLIENLNEHWALGKVPERLKERIKREKFQDIIKYLDERQIITIVGLRRTGKTTLMFQMMEHLMEKGVMPKNILYFSFDELTSKSPETIDEIIQHFASNISKSGMESKERKYIFFDEIQKVENWQAVIKRYYDLKYSLKFIVSGSESLLLRKKTKETMAGRSFDFLLTPMSFREYLEFNGIKAEKGTCREIYAKTITHHAKLKGMFEEFLLRGGFPETIGMDTHRLQEYLYESVLQKIVFSDIPSMFNISNPEMLVKIMELVSKNTSQLFEIGQICEVFNISRNSASSYLSYLENSFLISMSFNYTQSKVKQLRTRKKAYINDTGIANSLLKQVHIESPEYLGQLAETQIYNEISRRHPTLFWRDKMQHEVDIIAKNRKIIPVEVKYRATISTGDIKNMEIFMKKNSVAKGIIVTKDLFREEKSLIYIPAWIFLLSYETLME